MQLWVLEAGPAGWERKGLRVFREKEGVLAEMRSNLDPECRSRYGMERIEETRDDLVRFLDCHDDGDEAYEVAQGVRVEIEGNPDKIWILTLPEKPRNQFHVYTTKEEARQAFLQIYEDAGKPLSTFYEDDNYLFEHGPDYLPGWDESPELATAACCPIEDTPELLRFECPKCHCSNLCYIKDDCKYLVDLRYGRQIVHDNPSIVTPTIFHEKTPFYMCTNCFQIVMSEGRVIRDQNALADHIINEREKERIWLEIADSHEGDE